MERPEIERASSIAKLRLIPAVKQKIAKSYTIKRFLDGTGITREDIDNIMNTLALINALVLTIPYSVAGSLDYAFWDWLHETLSGPNCEDYVKACNNDPQECWLWAFQLTQNTMFGSVYSSISALSIAGVYYLLRPPSHEKETASKGAATPDTTDETPRPSRPSEVELSWEARQAKHFREWWNNARFVVLIVVCATFVSVVCVLTLFGTISSRYVNSTSHFCDTNPWPAVAIWVGVIIFIFFLLLSTYLLL